MAQLSTRLLQESSHDSHEVPGRLLRHGEQPEELRHFHRIEFDTQGVQNLFPQLGFAISNYCEGRDTVIITVLFVFVPCPQVLSLF